jgi:hypothetical protein
MRSIPKRFCLGSTSSRCLPRALADCRNPREVEDNSGALGWAISEAEMAEVEAVFARHGAVTSPDYWIEND